jgi:hypothetical protein
MGFLSLAPRYLSMAPQELNVEDVPKQIGKKDRSKFNFQMPCEIWHLWFGI